MLSKKYRLTKHGSFRYVYNKGERLGTSKFGLVFVKGKSLKVGFSVNNKVGCAVTRNKLKRRLRAIVREFVPMLNSAQIVIVAKPAAAVCSFDEIKAEILRLFAKAKLIKDETV